MLESRRYMRTKTFLLLCLSLFAYMPTQAQNYDTNNPAVQTFVGSGFYGHVDGQGTQTMFSNPSSLVVDSSSNFFVLDSLNFLIRKVTKDGLVTTFAGGGQFQPPGYGTNVSLQYNSFGDMAIDRSNVLWIAMPYSGGLLRVATDGLVQSVPLHGVLSPKGICVDSKNNLYVSDMSGQKIFRLNANLIMEVFVGSGNSGAVDGNGVFNSFSGPSTLAVDAADNIYVWDSYNYLLRRINQNRDVVTIAGKSGASSNADGVGTNASFTWIGGMAVNQAGNLILSSSTSVRRMTADANVTTIAGNFSSAGYANGAGARALFSNAGGLCLSQGKIFVADSGNHRIRSISVDSAPELVPDSALALEMLPGLRITGTIGRTYRVESSPNMTDWNFEGTILMTHSPYRWIDENALGGGKFYRAFLLP